MSPEEIFARNQRFNGAHSCIITDCGDGNFALHSWGGCGELLFVGSDPAALVEAMRNRPSYTYKLEIYDGEETADKAIRSRSSSRLSKRSAKTSMAASPNKAENTARIMAALIAGVPTP